MKHLANSIKLLGNIKITAGSLVEHAKHELGLAGLDKPDSDYGGMLADAVLELIEVFAAQGHSGSSAAMVLDLFNKLADFKTLSPITSNAAEWEDVSDFSGKEMWQSTRCPSCFSTDGGKTWYDLDEPGQPIHEGKD